MASVGHLLPGVTTVTPHARYYALHTLVAAEIERRELDAVAAQELLRRVEVTFAGVSLVHGASHHPSTMHPHGADKIRPHVAEGSLRVGDLAAEGAYAQAKRGFWGPYLASEVLLGLVEPGPNVMSLGEMVDEDAVRAGLGDVLGLAEHDALSTEVLAEYSHLCLCRAGQGSDGGFLLSRLLPEDAEPGSHGDRRAQTIRMLLRLFELRPGEEGDLWSVLAFDPDLVGDPVLSRLDVTHPWTGVVLRNQMVKAWRDLWAWLINGGDAMAHISSLRERLADEVPDTTVGRFIEALPAGFAPDRGLSPAEVQALSQPKPLQYIVTLAVSAGRSSSPLMPRGMAAYFEHPREIGSQLTPSWMAARLDEWRDGSMRDFTRWLVSTLIDRSQWIAMRKARFSRQSGAFQIPTRVSVRDDGLVVRYSPEGGGGVGLRWAQLVSVLAELGLLERDDAGWRVHDAQVWR